MTVERRARRRHIDNTERRSWGPDSAAALAEKRILVVDDDPDTRLFLRHLFRRVRAVVQEASSAVDAFASLRDFKPQLVISDIDMPIEDGCTLMRRIRELGADNGGLTPSIALTANEGTAERRKALQAGFNAYLTKPVAVASLIDTAATALR